MLVALLIRVVFGSVYGAEAQGLAEKITGLHRSLKSSGRDYPPYIVQCALVSAEDWRASKHPGYDMLSIIRACVKNLTGAGVEGGSTILQQLIRVLTRNYDRTAKRKAKEVILACLVSKLVDRNIVPAVYLSIAYYGTGLTGYKAVCARLGLQQEVSCIEDAAKIVARLKYPEPKKPSQYKRNKILARDLHIVGLYRKHKRTKCYEFLETV